jgi:signal transduction histidine kinase
MSSLELFGRIRTEIDDRLNKAGVALDWHDNVDVMDNRLSARFSTNLIRIIRELTTNALKHAQPNLMAIEIKQYSERFKITLQHDGLNHDAIPETWQEGRGWSSIRTRLAELGGTIDKKFGTKHQLSITLNIPTT